MVNHARSHRPASLAAFTLIELMIALLIISIVVVYFGRGLNSKANDSKITIARTQILSAIPSALASYYVSGVENTATLSTGSSGKALLVKRGVNPSSPWGGAWSVQSVSNLGNGNGVSVQVKYPMGGNSAEASKNIDIFIPSATSGSSGGRGEYNGPAQMPMVQKIKDLGSQNAILVTYIIS